MPGFQPGELVLLFLAPTGDPIRYRTVGLFQGAYRLQDTAGGPIAVQHKQHGALVVGTDASVALPRSEDLGAFITRIRLALELR